jgi:hypothetical protein
MNDDYLSLINKIDDIKNEICEGKYLELMNTVKSIYDNRIKPNKNNNDSDSDNESDYGESDDEAEEEDTFFGNMFEEYTCTCNQFSYTSSCDKSFLMFKYCRNYQKIVDVCPDILYIMKLNFPNIECNHKIKFIREFTLYNDVIFNSSLRFKGILKLLSKFTVISTPTPYIKRYVILIFFNYCVKYFVHLKDSHLKHDLFKKIREIYRYEKLQNFSYYTSILIEFNETIDLLPYWLHKIHKFL